MKLNIGCCCMILQKNYPDNKNLLSKLEEIQKVLNKIIRTAKTKINPLAV